MTNGGGTFGAGGYKTTDDLINLGGPGATTQYPGVSKVLNSLSIGAAVNTNVTTNASQHEEISKILGGASKCHHRFINHIIDKSAILGPEDNLLLLPSIKSVRKQQASPFKGGMTNNGGFFDMPTMLATQKMMRQTVRAVAAERSSHNFAPSYNPSKSPVNEKSAVNPRGSAQSADRNQSVKMNPKVLETWINETL
jgi:hypothetical protein